MDMNDNKKNNDKNINDIKKNNINKKINENMIKKENNKNNDVVKNKNNINEIKIQSNIEKEQKIEDEDDIIFNEFLNFEKKNNISNNHEKEKYKRLLDKNKIHQKENVKKENDSDSHKKK